MVSTRSRKPRPGNGDGSIPSPSANSPAIALGFLLSEVRRLLPDPPALLGAFPPLDFEPAGRVALQVDAAGGGFFEDEQTGILWNRSVPVLTNENHERYARLRAILIPPRAAVKAMGLSATSGVATKLEQNKGVQARIAELVADEEDVLREKRQAIEAGLSAIAYGDGKEFPGKNPQLDWPHRLGAFNQLRDMHGFKAPSKIAPTDPTGQKPYDIPTDADRVRALMALMERQQPTA